LTAYVPIFLHMKTPAPLTPPEATLALQLS
jgi:hypothetical protein